MRSIYRRSFLIAAVATALISSSALLAADKPVSMLLKDKGWFEQEFAKDGGAALWR